jgi:5-methylcytosine-specific restriction endonuclease McrA
VRKLPQPTTGHLLKAVPISPANQSLPPSSTAASLAPAITKPKAAPALVKPLAAERYKVQFTVTQETFEKLRRIQDLMRHSCPNGDIGIVFERALTMLLQHLEATKLAHVSRPQRPRETTPGSRHIPSAVRRAVWMRDNGRCAFIGARGRCPERGFLEFHHVMPFADGGRPVADNIQLRCRAHNQYESYQRFGTEDPPVVRERRDVSDWSNSVRTESPIESHVYVRPNLPLLNFRSQLATLEK